MPSRFSVSDENAQITRELAEKLFSEQSNQTVSSTVSLVYNLGLRCMLEGLFDWNRIFQGIPLRECLIQSLSDSKISITSADIEDQILPPLATIKPSAKIQKKKKSQISPVKDSADLLETQAIIADVEECNAEDSEQVDEDYDASFWAQYNKNS